MNNGCVICELFNNTVLSGITIGLSFPTQTTCPITTRNKIRFRYLSERVLQSTQNTNSGSSNASNATNTTQINPLLLDSTITICALPTSLCPTDTTRPSTFQAALTSVATDLSSASNYVTLAGASPTFAVPINTTNPYMVITDGTTISMAFISLSNFNYTLNGNSSFVVSSTIPMILYWKIVANNVVDSCQTIMSCNDITRCGFSGINFIPSLLNVTAWAAYSPSTNYILEGCATNYVPYAKTTTNSTVLVNFTTIAAPNITLNTLFGLSSNYLNFGICLLISLMALIFI